jgi:outer membrane protein
MKNILRTIFPAVLLLTFLGGSALAQTKVATVDMDKVFNNYWKTKQAQAAIDNNLSQLDKDDKSMREVLQKATDEYQQLLDQANDPAISAEERARRKQAAAEKQKQLEDRRAAIAQYEQTAQANINNQRQHMSDKIREDIQSHVNAAAKAGGYAIVLNTAAQKITLGSAQLNIPSPVVYSVSDIDLTDEVLKQLNAGAPIDVTATNAAPVITPGPSPLNTNGP